MTATEAKPPDGGANAGSGGSTGGMTYGKSWADDIQKYHAAKATLPWRPEQQAPVKHVTRYEKSREEREYDLVLGKFRDAERELKKQDGDVSKRKQDLEHSRARQLRNVQRFNLINHSPMYTGARDPKDPPEGLEATRPLRKLSSVDYNVVTNIPKPGAAAPASPPQSPQPLSPAAENRRRRMREFNILTNKYHDRHESREQSEHDRAKQIAAVKFYKKNDFHPVRIAFFDDNKEQKFVEERAHEQQIHGKDRVGKLPPREQFAEGKIYNIVNQSVINSTQISRYDGQAERAKNQKQQYAYEKRMLLLGQQLTEKAEQLCLNRYAHERHSQAFVHGFDPITNQSFDGINGKPRVPTRTHETLPAWQVLEQGVPSTNKVTVQANAKQPPKETDKAVASSSSGSQGDRRANILVVDHPATATAAAAAAAAALASPTPVQTTRDKPASTPTIRTGGFGNMLQ